VNKQTLGRPEGAQRSLPDRQPVDDWAYLRRGSQVEVWSDQLFLYTAYVDDHDEGRLLWVVEIGLGSRRLLVRDEDPVTLYSI
jgi:hypothetical protein